MRSIRARAALPPGWTRDVTFAIALTCALVGCDDGDGGGDTVSVSGTAFAFALPGSPYGLVNGGTVTVVEDPSLTATTNSDGTFTVEGVPVGIDATFALTADGYPDTNTKTFRVPGSGLERVTFQVPDDALFGLLADSLAIEPDASRCQIVSTVTRVGKSLYDEGAHGEEGAQVRIDPVPEAGEGPIYFNSSVLPDRALTETSDDGGVLFVNVPPGTYTLSANKSGVQFEEVSVECRAGALANASPPYGIQAL